jgi:hypothetical protein
VDREVEAGAARAIGEVGQPFHQVLLEGRDHPSLVEMESEQCLRQPGRVEAGRVEECLEQRLERLRGRPAGELVESHAERRGERPREREPGQLGGEGERLRGRRVTERRGALERRPVRGEPALAHRAQGSEHPARRAGGGHELGDPPLVAGLAPAPLERVEPRRLEAQHAVAHGGRAQEPRGRRRESEQPQLASSLLGGDAGRRELGQVGF